MLRSLFAAISGMRVNQTMLDVTGNNVANANTAGYKTSGTVFQDTLSQMLTGGSGGTATVGGTNPMQIGLGVQLASITSNMGQGAAQTTGVPTHMMIQGDGMFAVRRDGEELYTRAGAFTFDSSGRLVTGDGDVVQGYDPGGAYGDIVVPDLVATGGANPLQSYSIGIDGQISGVYADGTQAILGTVATATFANATGLEKVGDTMYRTSGNSGTAQIDRPGAAGHGKLLTGALEMSNVDLAQEFTNLIIAQRGFQANSRVITTSDQVLEDLVNIKR